MLELLYTDEAGRLLGQAMGQQRSGPPPAPPTRQTIVMTAAFAAGSSSTDGNTFNTPSFAPVIGQMYFIWAASALASGDPPQPALSHPGFTDGFATVLSARIGATGRRATLYRGKATGTNNAPVLMDYGASQTSALWVGATGTGIDATGANGANSVINTTSVNNAASLTAPSPAPVLPALEDPANACLAGILLALNTAATVADPAFATLGAVGVAASTGGVEAEWALNRTTCSPSWPSSPYAMVLAEIKSAPA